jgi:hypothetical protein
MKDLDPGSVSGVEKNPDTRIVINISDHISESFFWVENTEILNQFSVADLGWKNQIREKIHGIKIRNTEFLVS